jgi:hypothetical protein
VLNAIANPLTLVGPALVGLALVALITTTPRRDSAPTDAAPEPLAGPTPWRALGRLAVIPVAATLVFALLTSAPDAIPTGWLFYSITVPLSTVLFVVAWIAALRRRHSEFATAPQPET